MSGTRGVSLAVLILCLSLGFSVMAGLGIGGDSGVQLTGGLDSERKEVTGEMSDVESQGGGRRLQLAVHRRRADAQHAPASSSCTPARR